MPNFRNNHSKEISFTSPFLPSTKLSSLFPQKTLSISHIVVLLSLSLFDISLFSNILQQDQQRRTQQKSLASNIIITFLLFHSKHHIPLVLRSLRTMEPKYSISSVKIVEQITRRRSTDFPTAIVKLFSHILFPIRRPFRPTLTQWMWVDPKDVLGRPFATRSASVHCSAGSATSLPPPQRGEWMNHYHIMIGCGRGRLRRLHRPEAPQFTISVDSQFSVLQKFTTLWSRNNLHHLFQLLFRRTKRFYVCGGCLRRRRTSTPLWKL